MKLNRMILVVALGLLSTAAYAQTGRATGTPFGSGEDSIRCRQSISLLTSFGRTGNYADAYEPWQRAYNDCPAASKNIYIIGAKILHWKHAQAKTPADKKKILDRLMKLYDDRITYFGDDAKVGAAQIIADKIEDYKTLGGADADFTQVYKWAKPVVERYKEQTPIQVLYYYAFSSRLIASKDESKIDQYINEYTQAAEYADAVLAAAETDEAKKVIEVYKNQMDGEFAQSGLASCDKLEKTYTVDKIDQHKADKNYLQTVLALFQRAGCSCAASSRAGRYLFDMEPSVTAAMGIAGEAIREKRYTEATEFLNKAIDLAQNSSDRLKCYEALFQIAQVQRNSSAAITYGNKILAENPRNGKVLIYLAELSAGNASRYYQDDKIMQRCYYYLVINKLRHAASVDPSVAAQANRAIANYSRYLPSAQEIFMHPSIKRGATVSFGGESVVIP